MSFESFLPWRPRRCKPPQATCAGPLCEGPSLHRGLRPVRAVKDRVGTWETSSCPQPPRRSRVGSGRRGAEAGSEGRRSSDGCIVPMKPRTTLADRWGRRAWREGGRSKEGQGPTHAPDTEPESACHRRPAPTDRYWMGRPSPERRSRLTFGRSPVRESRTPGSARGARVIPSLPRRSRSGFRLPHRTPAALALEDPTNTIQPSGHPPQWGNPSTAERHVHSSH